MFSADLCCGNTATDIEDMMRRFANNSRYSEVYFKHDGKFVLTTFAGDALGTATWQQIRSDLATGTNPSTTAEPSALSTVSGAPSKCTVAYLPGSGILLGRRAAVSVCSADGLR
jgi:glucan endo-1,3-alpha-glucosidase